MATTAPSDDSGKLAFWDTKQEPILSLPNGLKMIKSDYFNHGGAEKFGHGDTIDIQHYRRECGLTGCNLAKLAVDENGYSFCPKCKTIYNDGKPPMRAKTSDKILEISAISRRQRNTALKKACRR